MAVNKVIYDGNTLVDLTGDTVTATDLADGVKATGADGNPIIGLMQKVTIDTELSATSTNPVANKVVYNALNNNSGGVSTSESNTWTGKQTFQKMKYNFESYNAPRVSGATDNPSSSVVVYNVQGNFTLDMSVLAGLLSNGDATLFTAYITSNGAYTLSINNAGTLKYVGTAADLAITSSGLLLNVLLTKNTSGDVTSIAQASKLS